MPYLTAQDMIDRYGASFLAEVTARDAAPGVVDMGVLQAAIDDAVSVTESYVAGLYNADTPPRALTMHAAAIAWHRLLGARAAAYDGAGNPQLPQISAPQATFSRDSLKGF